MNQAAVSHIASFIWGIADDVLRDVYVRGQYRDDMPSVQYQNANNSVSCSDAFMAAARGGLPFDLTAPTDGTTAETADREEV